MVKTSNNYRQLDLFEQINKSSLNEQINKIIYCNDTEVLNAISKSIVNFQQLPKEQKYSLSFSGGKDSHVLLGIYHLYLLLGNEPLNIKVKFADTGLEHSSLYKSIEQAKQYCEAKNITFEIVKGEKSYWWMQFVLGYPVPTYRIR